MMYDGSRDTPRDPKKGKFPTHCLGLQLSHHFTKYGLDKHRSTVWKAKYLKGTVQRVSTTLAKLVEKVAAGDIDTGGKFAAGVVDISGASWLANISANFQKNRNGPCSTTGKPTRSFATDQGQGTALSVSPQSLLPQERDMQGPTLLHCLWVLSRFFHRSTGRAQQ